MEELSRWKRFVRYSRRQTHCWPYRRRIWLLCCCDWPALACKASDFWPDSILNEQTLTGEPDTGYPYYKKAQVEEHLNEAWQCLQRDGFIAPSPGQNGRNGWMSLTRAGEEACKSADAFERVRASKLFSKALLHPSIANKVWSAIMRGDLDEAVRTSFIAVEVAVREAGKFAPSDIGVDLMRKAFHPDMGPLTRQSDEPAEREGLMHLFFRGHPVLQEPAFASVREAFRSV
jgi:Protein of unknown function (Hypoth_ymh)